MQADQLSNIATPGSLKRWLAGTGLILISVSLCVLLAHYYQSEVEYYLEGMHSGSTLLIFDEVLSHALFAIPALVFLAALCALDLFNIDIRKRKRHSPLVSTLRKCCGLGMLLGISFIFLGGFPVTSWWYSQFERTGYHKCDNNVFLISKSFANSAWVKDKNWCYDEGLRRILVNHHNNDGFSAAARYLREKY